MGFYIGNVYDFMNRSSLIPNLHKKSLEEKLNIVSDFALLSKEDQECLEKQIVLHENGTDSCDNESDKAIENIISAYSLPIGLATHFKINGCEYLIPMVLHTPSIVSIVSNAAKTAKVRGGFTAMVNGNTCRGQIQLLEVPFSFSEICHKIEQHKEKLMDTANMVHQTLRKMQKGVKDIVCREIDTRGAKMILVELMIEVGDTIGTQVVNSMCEKISPMIESLTNSRVGIHMMSDFTTERTVTAFVVFDKSIIGGERIVEDMVSVYELADKDVYRAVTQNKDVMNGIISVASATGQDVCAIEAAAHAYASRGGSYSSLTTWTKNENGHLVGMLDIPMSVGIVSEDTTSMHPIARICTQILKVDDADQFACILAAVGLAHSFAILKALVTEKGVK
jgi:hydroxymethylglutaryl-CoA reductase